MPISKENKKMYPKDWSKISKDIRFNRANNKCEVCGSTNHEPHPITGSKVVLTVAHLDHRPENCDYSNLKAMCQKCHNDYDSEHRIENRNRKEDLQKIIFSDALASLPDNPIVYISGKISGLAFNKVKKKFDKASKYIVKMGCVPVSPLNNGLPAESSWEDHMKSDILILLEADAIFMLNDWSESKGAAIERDLADNLGIKVIYQI